MKQALDLETDVAHAMANELGRLVANVAGPSPSRRVNFLREQEEVLLFQGRELPAEWRGAVYDRFTVQQIASARQWRVTFQSAWASDSIVIWFDEQKYSRSQVEAMASAYLDVINTRRA